MGRYIVRRIAALIPQLMIILALVVIMVDLTPGSVIDSMLGDSGVVTPEARAKLEKALGLDQSLPQRYVSYLTGVVQGDLGTSITRQRPVTDMIQERMLVTAELTLLAVMVSIVIGIPLGMAAAIYRGKVNDYLIRFFAVLFLGIPSFIVATLVVLLPALWFRWRPPLFVPWSSGVFPHLFSMILPVMAVSLVFMATNIRMMRSSFIDVMQQDYIRTARSKGLSSRTVWFGHGLKNALLPTVTLIGLQAAALVSGAVVVEQVFTLPGLGGVLFDALSRRDYPVIQGVVLLVGAAVVLLNLSIDVIYNMLDPRVSFE